MKAKKAILIIVTTISCITAFVLPFIFSTYKDSLLYTLSVSYTGLGAAATVGTLIIAIILYNKYGIESRFLERQTDKTLELVDYLKGKKVNISNKSLRFFSRFNIDDVEGLNNADFFKSFMNKTIIINVNDYEKFFNEIFEIRKSYWLPKEIREKIESLEYSAYEEEIIDSNNDMYARMDFVSKNDSRKYIVPYPRMSVSEYLKRKNLLIMTIIDWLDKHCNIKLDLRFEEPNQKLKT